MPHDFVGISAEDVFVGNPAYRDQNLQAQSAIGIGLIRQNFDWAAIETAPGQYDLSYYDEFVAAAASKGITILPILFHTPEFHLGRRDGTSACPPRDNASLAAYAQALVRRYGSNGTLWAERPDLPRVPIRSWQIWNEPNLGVYWCNRPNPREYASMLRVVGKAVKSEDPSAKIVTAGLPDSKLKSAMPLDKFISGLYKARGKRYFDTLAINGYATGNAQLSGLLNRVRRWMDRKHDRRAGIWITEIGWGDRGPKHRFIVGARGQATRIGSALTFIRKNQRALRLRGVVYFSWRDGAPYAPKFNDMWGLHTGLLDINGQPKPAYTAFGNRMKLFR